MISIENPNILELPDDCLIMVFSQLNFFDLLQVNETCKRFQILSLHNLKTVCNSIRIECTNHIDFAIAAADEQPTEMTLDDLERFFRNFGRYVKSLSFIGGDEVVVDISPVLYLVSEHCCGSVTALSLRNVQIDGAHIEALKDLFERLSDFEVIKALNHATLEKCIKYARNVKRLTIVGYHKDQLLLKIHSTLVEFFYDFVYIEIGHLRMFFQNHPNLTALKVLRVFTLTTELLHYLQNIRKLSINMKCVCDDSSKNNLIGLFQLKHVQQLELILSKNIGDLLGNVAGMPVTEIEVLALKARQIRDACDLLQAFTFINLKKLVICFNWNINPCGDMQPDEICWISKRLCNVEELHFINFTRDFFNKFVVQFVKYASKLKILVLSPKTPIDIRTGDLGSLAEVQQNKNARLTVKHEDGVNEAVKMFRSRESESGTNLSFENIGCYDYEFKYLND